MKDAILANAREYLADSESYKMQPGKSEYRSSDELAMIESAMEQKAGDMSTDFADELEAKGIVNPEDYSGKRQIIEATLDSYQNKFMKWLQEQ